MTCPDCHTRMKVARTTFNDTTLTTEREYRCPKCQRRLATRECVYAKLQPRRKSATGSMT